MAAAQALVDLTAISSQIEDAAVFDQSGSLVGSTIAGEAGGAALVQGARDLLAAAATVRRGGDSGLVRVEASLAEGGLFIVKEGALTIVATTVPEPTSGLVVYDLRACLRSLAAPAKPKRRRKRSEEPTDAAS